MTFKPIKIWEGGFEMQTQSFLNHYNKAVELGFEKKKFPVTSMYKKLYSQGPSSYVVEKTGFTGNTVLTMLKRLGIKRKSRGGPNHRGKK